MSAGGTAAPLFRQMPERVCGPAWTKMPPAFPVHPAGHCLTPFNCQRSALQKLPTNGPTRKFCIDLGSGCIIYTDGEPDFTLYSHPSDLSLCAFLWQTMMSSSGPSSND